MYMIPAFQELKDQLALIILKVNQIDDQIDQLEEFLEGEIDEEDSDNEPEDVEEDPGPEEDKKRKKSIRDLG